MLAVALSPGGMICVSIAVLMQIGILALLGAVLLRAAVAFSNRGSAPEEWIEEPTRPRAMIIVCVCWLTAGAPASLIYLQAGELRRPLDATDWVIIVSLAGACLMYLVVAMSAVLALLLPAKPRQAIVIAFQLLALIVPVGVGIGWMLSTPR